MTIKRFWEDSYRDSLDTRIKRVDGDQVTLDETIFFAFSGGQESDHGRIGGREVLEARKQGLDIVYRLPPDHGLSPGDAVRVEIDSDRRYRLMRHHFAAEMILELVTAALPGIEKIGAHISADKARIDFAWDESLKPLYPDWEQQARELVDADLPIITGFSDQASQRRYWEVAGFARVPCGGTHVRRTGEVGRLRLKRKNIGRGKERIEIIAEAP